MRRLPINEAIELIDDQSKVRFLIPKESARQLLSFIKPFQIVEDDEESITADEVFKDIYEVHGKIGAAIQGFRVRDNMTQKQLAQKLNVRQSHISEMEHGKRSIGKAMAHKLAGIFNTNYRLFL